MDARCIKVTAEELYPEVTMEEASRQAWAEQERRAEEDLPEEAPDWIGEVLMAEEPMTTDPLEGVDRRDLPEPVPERTAIDHAEAAALLFADGLTFQAKAELNKGLRKVRGLADVDALLCAADGWAALMSKSKRAGCSREVRPYDETPVRLPDGTTFKRVEYGYEGPPNGYGSCRAVNMWRVAEFR